MKYLIDQYRDEIPQDTIDFNNNQGGKNAIFSDGIGGDDDDDDLYEEAREIVISAGKASTSYLQRKLRVGYARAARLIDMLEERGVVGAGSGAKPRDIIGAEKVEEANVGEVDNSENIDESEEDVDDTDDKGVRE